MYDELIKRLRETPSIPVDAKLHNEAADAIEELQASVDGLTAQTIMVFEKTEGRTVIKFEPKWIPVTERLPDVFKHVLVNIPGMAPHPTVQEGFREKNGMWYLNGFRYEADDITHWMPLPQPPKDGES